MAPLSATDRNARYGMTNRLREERAMSKRKLEDLKGKNIVVYDLEIKKPIEKCSKGWASHDEMGISVGVAFDYREMRYRVFMDDNLDELVVRLNEFKTLIVAFNHISFDNKLLRATTPKGARTLLPDSNLKNYDMLVESRVGAKSTRNFEKGFKLDDHLKTLNLPMKTGEGALAPVWWQEGKIGKVIDYCVNDVTQEKALFEHIYLKERLACVAYPKGYAVRPPLEGVIV